MKTEILEASVAFIEQPFLKPLQLSSGLITQATEARVEVTVQVDGHEGTGRGSIYLSDLWAWPGMTPDRKTKDKTMRTTCSTIGDSLADLCGEEAAHPLELGLRLHHAVSDSAWHPEMPVLARAVCASPFDAAIHDATGNALGKSAFRFYDNEASIPSADVWFPGSGAVTAIRTSLRRPVNALDAWWIVGAGDDLEETVRPAVLERGIRCFKVKTLGRDSAQDAARTAEIHQAARSWGLSPRLSIDSNEGNPDAAAVLDFLERLEKLDAAAYADLVYLEQPTTREIAAFPQDWTEVTRRKPVLLDEGLTSMALLPMVRQQGWSGLAMKTCKGHSFNLVAAAWAAQNGLLLSLQDLTNPGYAAIHAYLLGAHVSTLNGVELNSMQFTPSANAPWLPQLSGLFEPREGQHRLLQTNIFGLGSSLVNL